MVSIQVDHSIRLHGKWGIAEGGPGKLEASSVKVPVSVPLPASRIFRNWNLPTGLDRRQKLFIWVNARSVPSSFEINDQVKLPEEPENVDRILPTNFGLDSSPDTAENGDISEFWFEISDAVKEFNRVSIAWHEEFTLNSVRIIIASEMR